MKQPAVVKKNIWSRLKPWLSASVVVAAMALAYTVSYFVSKSGVEATGRAISSKQEAESSDGDVRWNLYALTNGERDKAKLNLLDYSPYLSAAAQDKCEDMASRDYWSHETPEGEEPWGFIKSKGVVYSTAAENLAYGYDSEEDIVKGWMESEGHRKNMLDPKLQQVGFGVCTAEVFQGQPKQAIIVQFFTSNL